MFRAVVWMLAVILGGSSSRAATAEDPNVRLSEPETFAKPAAAEPWTFGDGPEWPGARGALEYVAGLGRTKDGALVLRYDFSGGGNYVSAGVDLPSDAPVTAVRFWVHKPTANMLTLRAVDQDGETFQKHLRFDYRGWQQVEITLDGWGHHWGGDGVWRGPAKRFEILVENEGTGRKGDLLIDDVQWVSGAAAAKPATSTYTESAFAAGTAWRMENPSQGTWEPPQWRCVLAKAGGRSVLKYGASLLGRPQALRLTVRTKLAGQHELWARCGSHFQMFERKVGTLEAEGEQTLEVPLGDMGAWRHFGGEDDGVVRLPLRLEELAMVAGTADADASVELVRLEVVTEYDPERPLVLVPGVKAQGDVLAYTAEIRSLHNKPLAGRLYFDGRPVGGATPTVPVGGRVRVEVAGGKWRAPCAGATLEFVAEPYTTGPELATIARVPELPGKPPLAPESTLGVGLYLYRQIDAPDARAEMDKLARLAAAAGVKWTREEFQWHRLEPKEEQFDFSFYDQLVDVATSNGISVYALCCYTTDWAQPPIDDAFIAKYCNYLRQIVGRYKDRIHHWEIWNEPNIFFWPGPKDRYPILLKHAYEAIKSVDPEAQVLGCSTAGIDRAFIQMVLDAGAPFDALTIHPYRGDLDVHGFMRELQQTRELAGGRDVWITEMGWSSEIGGATERQQASYVARTYIAACASPGVRSTAWYDFREDGPDPFYNEYHFGLVRPDLTPKAGYAALATVGRWLGTTRFVEKVGLGDGVAAFRFAPRSGEGKHVLVLWATDASRVVRLECGSGDVTLQGALGEEATGAPVGEGWVTALERGMPLYVVGDRPVEVKLSASPITVEAEMATVHPGQPLRLAVRAATDARVREVRVPPGWVVVSQASNGIAIRSPRWARAGQHVVVAEVSIAKGDGTSCVLAVPVEVTVVPTLVRG